MYKLFKNSLSKIGNSKNGVLNRFAVVVAQKALDGYFCFVTPYFTVSQKIKNCYKI